MVGTKSLILLLFSLLLCSYCFGYEVLVKIDAEDPKGTRAEIESCKRRCETETRGGRQIQQCQQRCEEEAIKRREREQEKEQEQQHRSERQTKDPERQYHECRQSCRRQSPRQQTQCESWCRQQYEDQKRRQEEGYPMIEEEQSENPYYFPKRRLQIRFDSEHGRLKFLERFNKKSHLLRGIENYRLAFWDLNGNTFIRPHHCDAESVAFVVRGKATLTLVTKNNKETHNLERGDVLRLRAGTTVYGGNRDENERFLVAILAQPVNAPGNLKEYFSAGGGNPESFFKVFSDEILESSFDTSRDQIDKLFRQKKQGAIVKASREQIEALSRHASTQRTRESSRLFNLLQQKPVDSNRFGRIFEAKPEEFNQLKDVDVSVNYFDIKQGSVMVPHFNSRSTIVAVVEQGKGRIEMACPHVGRQESERRWSPREEQEEEDEDSEGRVQYQKVSTELSAGDIFVIPAGHPHAVISSQNENLRAVCFGINAWNNQRNFLAGKDSLLNQVEREAKELSFNEKWEKVEQILGKQQESYFVQSRGQRGEEEKRRPLASILDSTNYF